MADPPGTIRRIDDPQAEIDRLAFERQVSAAQICADGDRQLACVAGCEFRAPHCAWHHTERYRRLHDPDHCDRAWAAREAAGG